MRINRLGPSERRPRFSPYHLITFSLFHFQTRLREGIPAGKWVRERDSRTSGFSHMGASRSRLASKFCRVAPVCNRWATEPRPSGSGSPACKGSGSPARIESASPARIESASPACMKSRRLQPARSSAHICTRPAEGCWPRSRAPARQPSPLPGGLQGLASAKCEKCAGKDSRSKWVRERIPAPAITGYKPVPQQ